MARVIEALREEHRNIGRLLQALEREIDVFASGETPDYDVVVGVADYFLDYPDRCHHPKEDAIVARLEAAHPALTRGAVSDLVGAHRILHDRALRFRETIAALLADTDIARDTVVTAARRFMDAEWAHMRMEETSVFPLAERVLSEADWQAVEGALAARQDPVFGDRVEAVFRRLSERLLAWEAEGEAKGRSPPAIVRS